MTFAQHMIFGCDLFILDASKNHNESSGWPNTEATHSVDYHKLGNDKWKLNGEKEHMQLKTDKWKTVQKLAL